MLVWVRPRIEQAAPQSPPQGRRGEQPRGTGSVLGRSEHRAWQPRKGCTAPAWPDPRTRSRRQDATLAGSRRGSLRSAFGPGLASPVRTFPGGARRHAANPVTRPCSSAPPVAGNSPASGSGGRARPGSAGTRRRAGKQRCAHRRAGGGRVSGRACSRRRMWAVGAEGFAVRGEEVINQRRWGWLVIDVRER